jgi:hypothetical protein
MDRMEWREGRTDDLSWARQQRSTSQRCFFCGRAGATGSTILGGPLPGNMRGQASGSRVPCCGVGEGCKDGRIFHGPPSFATHWPDEPCGICSRAGTQDPAKKSRISRNSTRRVRPGGNDSSHHR